MKKSFNYAGHSWLMYKHARFGIGPLVYELIFGETFVDGNPKYICYLKDIDRGKLIEVQISNSFLVASERYFYLLSNYA